MNVKKQPRAADTFSKCFFLLILFLFDKLNDGAFGSILHDLCYIYRRLTKTK